MAYKIMIQGTMSGAGKSLLCAGLLRVFKKDGYKCAPFKSQNMALNSYITDDGCEIGRAQAMQAEAAETIPSVYMNPILLKPNSNVGSQVIVNGKAIGNMKAGDYFEYKKSLFPVIKDAFKKLEDEYDIIVIEGAGSPAEINLKENDIVNMGLAKELGANVLLVSNIDPGGVFAQIYGTVALLEESEQDLIKGVIINKFRGDVNLLMPGIKQIEDLMQKEPINKKIDVLGVVPYMNIDVEDEDSLSNRINITKNRDLLSNRIDAAKNSDLLSTKIDAAKNKDLLSSKIDESKSKDTNLSGPEQDRQYNGDKKLPKVVVIKLPHMSNYTDFDPLQRMDAIDFWYTIYEKDIDDADMIIIPGTKNTIYDLKWLKEMGLSKKIVEKAKTSLVFGICGGFQILGKEIADPFEIENGGKEVGLALLDVKTTIQKEKVKTKSMGTTKKLNGPFEKISNIDVKGYEIHMGDTRPCIDENNFYFAKVEDFCGKQKYDGYFEGNVCGTYLHGIFENDEFRNKFIEILYDRKNLPLDDMFFYEQNKYKEEQFDILEKTVRGSIDIAKIYEIMGLKNI